VSAPPPTATAPTTPAPLRRPLAWASDERLAELTRDGDERAFGVIVERHRPQLLAHARRIAGEPTRTVLNALGKVAFWVEIGA